MSMKVQYARSILKIVSSGTLGFGTLWVNGYLDEAHEALGVVKKANRRNAKKRKSVDRANGK